MPDFTIDGDPGAIRSRCASMRSKGTSFHDVADSLAKVDTRGWEGRAADRFHEKFQPQPEKWRQAGDGFIKAAGALEGYADALQRAQDRARQAAADYARGEQASQTAKSEYDASVNSARNKVDAARTAGRIMQLIIEPFHDPGTAIRQQAQDDYEAAKSDLEKAAQACASEVRASHAGAPNTRDFWHESGLHGAYEVGKGAVEGLVDIGKLALALGPPPIGAITDLSELISGQLTPQEFVDKYKLKLEEVEGLAKAAWDHPWEFTKTLGSAMIDLNTWKDNPAEAFGKLIPTIVLTAVTVGAGSAAKGAEAGAEGLETLATDAADNSASMTADASRAYLTYETATPSEAAGALDQAQSAGHAADEAAAVNRDVRVAADTAKEHAELLEKLHHILHKTHDVHTISEAATRLHEGVDEYGKDASQEHVDHTLERAER